MLLNNHDRYDWIGLLNGASGQFQEVERNAIPASDQTIVAGYYAHVGCHLIMLYPLGTRLILRIDDKTSDLADCRIQSVPGPSGSLIRIWQHEALVLEERIPAAEPPVDKNDPTFGADPEDFDFGLFLANVSKDLQRQERIKRITPP